MKVKLGVVILWGMCTIFGWYSVHVWHANPIHSTIYTISAEEYNEQ